MRPIAIKIPDDKITLIPAGCLHRPVGDLKIFRLWRDTVKNDPTARTILMGDTMDYARGKYRNYLKGYVADSNSNMAAEEWHRRDVEDLAKELMPIREKIFGAILGNHYAVFNDGTNSEQYLCQLLKIPYFGPTCVIRLDFRDKNHKTSKITIFAHHNGGSSGGRGWGGDVSALTRQEQTWDADIYLLSHTHKKIGFMEPVMTLTTKGTPRTIEKTRVFVRTGAFLKSYNDIKPESNKPYVASYAEEKAYRPVSLGWISVKINIKRISNGISRPVYDISNASGKP